MLPSRRLLLLLATLVGLLIVPLAASQGTMSITVSSDKTQYLHGETVRVFGKVADSMGTPVLGAAISIQVGDPPTFIEVVYSDSSGAYSLSFVLSTSMAPGQYAVYATASKPGYTSAQQRTQFTVLPESTTITTTTSPPTSQLKCLIATATYGSEIAPEVAVLRSFRDAQIMQTSAGRSFMQSFNAFYYSFSPQVASFISAHALIRSGMKVILYPLIAILYVSSRIFQLLSFDGELAVVFSGIFAAFGIGFAYFGPIAIIGSWFLKTRIATRSLAWKLVVPACLISSLTLFMADVSRTPGFVAGSDVAVVLSFLFLGALATKSLYRSNRNCKQTSNVELL